MAESPKAAEKGKRRSLQSCLCEDSCEQFYPKKADQGEKDMRNKAENVLHLWNESAKKTAGNNKKNSNYNMRTTLDNIPTAGKSITNNLINTTEVQFQLLQKTFGKLNIILLSSVDHFAS